MRVRISTNERFPTLTIDARASGKDFVSVPDYLVQAIEGANEALVKAEAELIRHLRESGQPVPEAYR